MPNAANRCATNAPIRPSPRMPAVFPSSSMPENRLRCHSPRRSEALAGAMCLAAAMSSPTASSAALTMFDCGAFTTMTPAEVAAGTSMLSSPTPARATTRRRRLARSTSASTLVALRTSRASASRTPSIRAARSVPSQKRTSKSGPSAATVAGESSSAMRTTGGVIVTMVCGSS